jgi:2-keto-4-pentenoate hydratase/2-oxohepta-3-ene-1,7-dioic acid hydratase in catechol pathway
LTSKETFGKIVCMGKNYLAHAEEMQDILCDVQKPLIFLKPSSSVVLEPSPIVLPPYSHEIHHEIELAVEIATNGKNISVAQAENIIAGYRIGLDLTARDIQREAKKMGWPWLTAKGFDTACPLSRLYKKSEVKESVNNTSIVLYVNKKKRQESNTSKMILGIKEVISYISFYFSLEKGDIILTGTPEGVGKIEAGDELTAVIGALGTMHFSVTEADL